MNENSVTKWDVLDTAFEGLRTAVAGVGPQDWERPTPCADWNVTQVLQHAAGDQIAYNAAITGGPGPSYNPFAPSGQLDDDPVAFLDVALKASGDALGTVGKDDKEVPCPLPQGPMDAWIVVGAAAIDAGVHAWDIAVATGQPSPLTPEFAKQLHAVAVQIVEPLRGFAYVDALEPQPGDDEVAALLRYLGRRPDWTA